MNNSLFSGIIQSKLKIKLLLRFFTNPDSRAYLRQLSKEFSVSSNAVRSELTHLSGSDLITAEKQGRKIWYKANAKHPLFPELGSMAKKCWAWTRSSTASSAGLEPGTGLSAG